MQNLIQLFNHQANHRLLRYRIPRATRFFSSHHQIPHDLSQLLMVSLYSLCVSRSHRSRHRHLISSHLRQPPKFSVSDGMAPSSNAVRQPTIKPPPPSLSHPSGNPAPNVKPPPDFPRLKSAVHGKPVQPLRVKEPPVKAPPSHLIPPLSTIRQDQFPSPLPNSPVSDGIELASRQPNFFQPFPKPSQSIIAHDQVPPEAFEIIVDFVFFPI